MTTLEFRRRVPRWARPLQRPMRYKGASGGRGSGKSHFFAEEAVERMVVNPAARIVCIREVQRSLKFSAKALVEGKIRELGVAHLFLVLTTEIRRLGGPGIMIFEGMQDHTADSIKSLEGFDVAWVEEAQSISQRSLDLLIPTIRAEGSELWFSWNPDKKTDAVDQFFASGRDGMVHVHTTYRDNPFLPSTLRKEAEAMRLADPDKYDHVWLGKYDLGGKGRVYAKFVDKPFPEGNVDPSVRDFGGEILIGQDFNINPMATIIAVRAVDECHVLDALLVPTSNTEEVCAEVRRRYPNRYVVFCPDPAGNARHTNAKAGQTDFTIIRSFGFEVRAPSAHPPVVDRVNNANTMLCDDRGRRRVRIHPKAQHLIDSLGSQVYKPDTNIPDKTGGYDHPCFAADTLVETPAGFVPMADLPSSGLVRGPFGEWVAYVGARCTRRQADVVELRFETGEAVVCTPDHRWLTSRGWMRAVDLTESTGCIELCDIESLATRSKSLTASRTIGAGSTSSEAESACTASSAKRCTGRSLAARMSTMWTGTPATTRQTISSSSTLASTSWGTCENPSALPTHSALFNPRSVLPQSGTEARKGGHGIAHILHEHARPFCAHTQLAVNSAESNTKADGRIQRLSARLAARPRFGGPIASTMRPELARIAALSSSATDSCPRNTAGGAVARLHGKLISARRVSSRDVYDLCVPGVGAFALASGFVVSNCDAFGYLLWQEFNLLASSALSVSSYDIG